MILLFSITYNTITVDSLFSKNKSIVYRMLVDDTEPGDTLHLSFTKVYITTDSSCLYLLLDTPDTLHLNWVGDLFVAVDTGTGGGYEGVWVKHVLIPGADFVFAFEDTGNAWLLRWDNGWSQSPGGIEEFGPWRKERTEIRIPLDSIGRPQSAGFGFYTTRETGDGIPDYLFDNSRYASVNPLDTTLDGDYIFVDTSQISSYAGANLDSLFFSWDSTGLYLSFTAKNTESWDVAYGIGLDWKSGGYTGGGDAWGREINTSSGLDAEIYFWWSGVDSAITSMDFCRFTGTGWRYDSLEEWSCKGKNGLQFLEIKIPWDSLGGVPQEIKIAVWICGGDGSSAVDKIPYETTLEDGADEWTDTDSFSVFYSIFPDKDVVEDITGTLSSGPAASSLSYTVFDSLYYPFAPPGFMGLLDAGLDTSGWEPDECLPASDGKRAWFTYDSLNLYFGYTYQAWDEGGLGEGDFFIYLDTDPVRNGNGTVHDVVWGTPDHDVILPFRADYAFCLEDGSYYTLKYWNGTEWRDTSFTGDVYAGWEGNGITEIRIPLQDIGNPERFSFLVLALGETEGYPWGESPPGRSGDTLFSFWGYYPLREGIEISSIRNRFYAGKLLISEFLPNPVVPDTLGEWMEIYNPNEFPVYLGDYKIGDEETQGGGEGMYIFPSDTIHPHEFRVIAQRADGFYSIYGFYPDYELRNSLPSIPDLTPYTSWATGEVYLSNTGDEILLLDASDYVVDYVNYGTGTNPAPIPPEGSSCERIPPSRDTDTSSVDFIVMEYPTPGNGINLVGNCENELVSVPDSSMGDTLTLLRDHGNMGDMAAGDGIYTLEAVSISPCTGYYCLWRENAWVDTLKRPITFNAGDTVKVFFDVRDRNDGFLPSKNISYNSSFPEIIKKPYLYGNLTSWNPEDTSFMLLPEGSLYVFFGEVPLSVCSFYVAADSCFIGAYGLSLEKKGMMVVSLSSGEWLRVQVDPVRGRVKAEGVIPIPPVVINEFATSPDDMVELYNAGDDTVYLDKWTISGDTLISGLSIPPGGYLVITVAECPGLNLWKTTGTIILCDSLGREVDRVAYGRGGGAPDPLDGESCARSPDGIDTGNDARDFNLDPTPTFGAPNDLPPSALGDSLVWINEVKWGEFLELYNPSWEDRNLGGYSIVCNTRYVLPDTFIKGKGYLTIPYDLWTSSSSDSYVVFIFDPDGRRIDQFGWYGYPCDSSWVVMPDGNRTTFEGYDWFTSGFVCSLASPGVSNAGWIEPDSLWGEGGEGEIRLYWKGCPGAVKYYIWLKGDSLWGSPIDSTTDTFYVYATLDTGLYAVSAVYPGGYSPRTDPIELFPAGIRERKPGIYPFISRGVFYLSVPDGEEVTLYDVRGRRVWRGKVRNGKIHLDVPSGVYFIKTEKIKGKVVVIK